MTPKDLEHWRRIFAAGYAAAGTGTLGSALYRMTAECRKLRDEENAIDAAESAELHESSDAEDPGDSKP